MAMLAVFAGFVVVSDAWAGKVVDRVVAGTSASGTTQGLFNTPRGLAVNYSSVADGTTDPTGDSTNGYIYVADADNHRVQVYSADGTFRFMFGRGVQTGANAPEICDRTETPCQGGSSFTGVQGGMFNQPHAIAINQQTGHVFVRERANNRIQEFTAAGTFVKAWGWGVATGTTAFETCTTQASCLVGLNGANGGQFGLPNFTVNTVGIAVNQTNGHVIATDPVNRRVQEFDPAGIGTGVFVRLWGWDVVNTGQPGDIGLSNFEICTSATTGVCKTAAAGIETNVENGRFSNGEPKHVAADSAGRVFTSNTGPAADGSTFVARVDVFNSTQATPALLSGSSFVVKDVAGDAGAATTALDVVPGSGNLLVARSGEAARVVEFANPGGAVSVADRHYVDSGLSPAGVAIDPVSGDLFASASQRVFAADANGAPAALMSIEPPSGVGSRTATLNGTVNSVGVFATAWRLEVSRNGTSWTTVSSGNVAGGNLVVPVSGQATGLRPNTLYRSRLVTHREFGNPDIASAELTFATDAEAPELAVVSADSVGATTARLSGRVNPHSTPASYRFEWGKDNFTNSIPVPDGPVGNGPEFVFVAQQLAGLQSATTYQFRLVATSASEGTTTGATHTFTTKTSDQPAGPRGLELVSPPDKVGAPGLGWWYNGPGATMLSGIAAYKGDRFAANSHNGGTLLPDGGYSYANEIALCQRINNTTGWGCHPAITNPASRSQLYRAAVPRRGASDDLSLMGWETNTGLLNPFPEMGDWTAARVNNPLFVGDWQGRWEIYGPTNLGQLNAPGDADPGAGDRGAAIAANGGYAVASTNIRGMGGAGDPSVDMVARPARSTYLDDLTGGVSNTFPGTGVRSLVQVCTPATMLPARVEVSPGVFAIDNQACPAPAPSRDAALISSRGATIQVGTGNTQRNSTRRIVSRDGSRVFFMSPDPAAAGVPTAGCSGTAVASLCPSQLFVRQRNSDGSVVTRWISKPVNSLLGVQAASLAGQAIYEGASDDGSRVFFRTNAPLTADDPNAGCGTPCLTGTPSADSWDLYMYELAPGNDPTGPGGQLTRISRGPNGNGDCNSPIGGNSPSLLDGPGALRLVSVDGQTVYFTCAAPLPSVVTPADATRITAPGGTATTTTDSNLYLYTDAGNTPSWRFIARIARSTVDTVAATCTSTSVDSSSTLDNSTGTGVANNVGFTTGKCVHGTDDGEFATFWTPSVLTTDDPEAGSMDIYAYDSASDTLKRITASQDGVGTGYPCGLPGGPGGIVASQTLCHGDPGYQFFNTLPLLGVATDPPNPEDRIAFFQSRSRLIAADTDDAYDVYQWKNGELSLLSTGKSSTDGAFYKGNDYSGQNVYMVTRDQLTWQDHDQVLDSYTARIGGGIIEPPPPSACNALAGTCRAEDDQAITPTASVTQSAGGGNAAPGTRVRLSVGSVSGRAVRSVVRSGVLAVRVRSGGVGRVVVSASGRVGGRARRVASAAVRVGRPGSVVVRLRLSGAARRQLRARRVLRLSVEASMPGARGASKSIVLRRASR